MNEPERRNPAKTVAFVVVVAVAMTVLMGVVVVATAAVLMFVLS